MSGTDPARSPSADARGRRHGVARRAATGAVVAAGLLLAATSACVPSQASPAPTGSPVFSAAPPTTASGVLDRVLVDTDDDRARRDLLVDAYIAGRIGDQRVVDAMRAVPRHSFVPTNVVGEAYNDYPLPIGSGQTISQPSLVAEMTELLEIEPGERVLEIGTGSGYQAAILRELTDRVYSVEIIPELATTARAVLEALGYDDIRLERRDGYFGWPGEGPFDAIVVTAAPDHLPSPLVDQLAPGGRMVIPIGPQGDVQMLWLVTREGGEVRMEQLLPVQFVPLTREGG